MHQMWIGEPERETAWDRWSDDKPYGDGLVLWFEIADINAAIVRAVEMKAEIVVRTTGLHDPRGYTVVLASPDGSGGNGSNRLPMPGLGHKQPPSFANGAAGPASIADANGHATGHWALSFLRWYATAFITPRLNERSNLPQIAPSTKGKAAGPAPITGGKGKTNDEQAPAEAPKTKSRRKPA
jgi:hypothetical protein